MRSPATTAVAAREQNPALVLGLLTLVQMSGYADRNIINLLMDPIKHELGASDTLLGLVTGFGFTFFHLLFAIPVARWADRWSRLAILTTGLVVWSVMTGLTAFATSLLLIGLCRVGVGLGEATMQGPTHSMISDSFPKERRPVAFSILSCGVELGIMAGLLIGGWVGQIWGWRAAFLVAGAPGLAIALALRLLIREPPRGASEAAQRPPPPLPFRRAVRVLFDQRSYVLCVVGGVFIGFTVFTTQAWGPTFLRRVHHLDSAILGTYTAFVRGPCAIAGTLIGGYLAQRLGRKSDVWRGRVPALACLLTVPFFYLFLFADWLPMAFAAFGALTICIGMQVAPVLAVCQTVAPQRARALASALFFFPVQMIGLGVGALLIGALSDWLTPLYGALGLRYALLFPASTGILAALAFWLAGRSVAADAERARQFDGPGATPSSVAV